MMMYSRGEEHAARLETQNLPASYSTRQNLPSYPFGTRPARVKMPGETPRFRSAKKVKIISSLLQASYKYQKSFWPPWYQSCLAMGQTCAQANDSSSYP